MKYKGEQKEKEQGASLKLARKVRVRGTIPSILFKGIGAGQLSGYLLKINIRIKIKNLI